MDGMMIKKAVKLLFLNYYQNIFFFLRIKVQQSPSKTKWFVINIQEISHASTWSFRPQVHLHPPQEQFLY